MNKNAKFREISFFPLMNKENVGTGVHYLILPEHAFYKERFG